MAGRGARGGAGVGRRGCRVSSKRLNRSSIGRPPYSSVGIPALGPLHAAERAEDQRWRATQYAAAGSPFVDSRRLFTPSSDGEESRPSRDTLKGVDAAILERQS